VVFSSPFFFNWYTITNCQSDLKPSSNRPTPDPPLRNNQLQPVPPMFLNTQLSVDEWSFLNNFGDPKDEFFTMDASFRELLQHQLEPSSNIGT